MTCDLAYESIKLELTQFNRQTGLNFLPFMEITKAAVAYKSTYDGFVGLQPYQASDVVSNLYKGASVPASSFITALREHNVIENEVFQIQHLNDTSAVIKFGGWDATAFDGALRVLECNTKTDYTLVMQ